MNFAPQRPLLTKVVHVIGIPPRLYIVHNLQALYAQRAAIIYSVRERVLH